MGWRWHCCWDQSVPQSPLPISVHGPLALYSLLRTNRVLEDLFQERPHLELMKRSLPVLQFLAKHKALTAADLALVWGASVTSHEPTIESVYQTVGVLAAHPARGRAHASGHGAA